MTRILVVGVGHVGARAARQLAETPGVDVLVADRHRARADQVARSLGATAVRVPGRDDLPDVDALALAVPAGLDVDLARLALARGVPVATAGDDHEGIRRLLELDATALDAGTTVVGGCALAPGLADVLVRHATSVLDHADEVHVARAGVAGPACRHALRQARRDRSVEWHDDAWRIGRRRGAEQVWFPDPVGAQECEVVAGGIALLVGAFPAVTRATYRYAEAPRHRRVPSLRPHLDEDWGAIRVEVWGVRGQTREAIVYGAIERTAVAAGAVLALGAGALAGALPGVLEARPGVHGLGALAEPVGFLAELARRGVKAAAFAGAGVA